MQDRAEELKGLAVMGWAVTLVLFILWCLLYSVASEAGGLWVGLSALLVFSVAGALATTAAWSSRRAKQQPSGTTLPPTRRNDATFASRQVADRRTSSEQADEETTRAD